MIFLIIQVTSDLVILNYFLILLVVPLASRGSEFEGMRGEGRRITQNHTRLKSKN